jgi:NADPH:quinone reductase-like Zn-dependent oxidoreductase
MAPTTPIRKVLIPTFGDVSVLTVVDDAIPPPAAGEVQVAPIYSGFSGADVNMRKGVYPMQRKAPLTPGYSLAGRVVSCNSKNSGPDQFQPGDLVACLTVYDAQSTLVNLPAKYLVPVPEGVDPATATALILDWATAYGMVYRAAAVSKGQRVFVHGLSGAVGNALLQLCRLRGAEVYGTASARNHEALRQQGATPFVYTDKKWIAAMKELGGAHAVFDPLGYESWDESYDILPDSESGILIGYGGNADSLSSESSGRARSVVGPTVKLLARGAKFWQNKRTTFYWISRDQATFRPELQELFRMAKDKEFTVGIKKVGEMENIQEAHRAWGSCPGMGSMLVRITEDKGKL